MERKYKFSWELLGDIADGRPNLGPTVRMEVYRLMQYCFRDVIEKNFGTEKTDQIFYEAGQLAGEEFYKNIIKEKENIGDFIKDLQKVLADMKIGILRVEEADWETGRLVLTIAEDMDCSGLPELDYEICIFDEGFIAGILTSFTNKKYTVKEVDCWCTGDRTCRFVAKVVS